MAKKRYNYKDRVMVKDVMAADLYVALEGDIDNVISNLKDYKEKYLNKEKGYDSLIIDFESYGYDGGIDMVLYGRRLENDKEYKKRVEAEEKKRERNKEYKKNQLKEEEELYKKLKKKFEKKKVK